MKANELEALNIATKICVAKASNTTLTINGKGGEAMGDFFEAIYKKVLDIEDSAGPKLNKD